MFRSVAIRTAVILLASALSGTAYAQVAFKKENFHFNEWTKGRFAEAVAVTGPAKWVYLAGVGAEAEKDGSILHLGDFMGQCRYAFDKIRKALAATGATLGDVVKMTSYVVDIRDREALNKCRADAFSGLPLPAHTFLAISQLARPGMLVEIEVVAAVAAK